MNERSAPGERLFWLMPVLFLAHVLEEVLGGFPAWATLHFGRITTPRFFAVSHVPLIVGGFVFAHAGARAPGGSRAMFLAFATQVVMGTNGVFHLMTTFLFREYSPGVGTSLALFFPFTAVLTRKLVRDGALSPRQLLLASALGTAVSALVVASLFVDVELF